MDDAACTQPPGTIVPVVDFSRCMTVTQSARPAGREDPAESIPLEISQIQMHRFM